MKPKTLFRKFLHLCFFVFTISLSAQDWTQLGSDIDGEAAGDQSGYSVSLSQDGSRVAIGANNNDGNGSASGHIRVFEFNGNGWEQLGADINGETAGDLSGFSVSMSADGSRLAVGAPANDGTGSNSGHVRVFEYNGSTWIQLGADINGELADDTSGRAVALNSDGSRVAIGANGNDGNGTASGHVRIFQFNGTSWVQLGSDLDGELTSDQSGFSLDLNDIGNRVAIGAVGNDGNGSLAGHVRVYIYNGVDWGQLGSDIDGEFAGDQSGYSVGLDGLGNRLAIGANGNDGNGSASGHVRVFEFNGVFWNQLGSDIDGEAAGDQFGRSVNLSQDGSRLAIGAVENDGNGSNSGHARVFDYDGNNWVQVGIDLDGEAIGDNSGWSISLSPDGSRVAIGAPGNDGIGSAAGHIRIFEFRDTELPVITCPSDITQNAGINCTDFVTLTDPTATDNLTTAENLVYTGVRSDGALLSDPFFVGVTNITWTATDKAGNTSEACVQQITVTSTSNCWEKVGGDLISAGDADNLSFAKDANGNLFVAYRDYAIGGISVSRFQNNQWETLGDPVYVDGGFLSPQLAVSLDGIPHVSYYNNQLGRHIIKRFVNGIWQEFAGVIEGAAFEFGTGIIGFNSSNELHVMYGTLENKLSLKKWDGTNWNIVGTTLFSNPTLSYSFDFDSNGLPYVAYQQTDINPQRLTVQRFNGTDWEFVGSPGFSQGSGAFSDIALSPDDIPYVAYYDSGGTNVVQVVRFNDNIWQAVGNTPFAGLVTSNSIDFDSGGTPYLGFKVNPSLRTVVRLENNVWTPLGQAIAQNNVGDFFENMEICLDNSDAQNPIVYSVYALDGIYAKSYQADLLDAQAPEIICPIDVVQDAGTACSTAVTITEPTATDNVSTSFTYQGLRSDGFALTDPYFVGETTISWTATDEAGNTSEACSQIITVNSSGDCWFNIGPELVGSSDQARLGFGVTINGEGNMAAYVIPNANGNESIGTVIVLERNGNTWSQLGNSIAGGFGNGRGFSGIDLNDSGDRLAVSIGNGDVNVYELANGNWLPLGTTIGALGAAGFQKVDFDASGNQLAIGYAIGQNGEGSAAVFQLQGGNWVQKGSVLNGDNPGDTFGRDVSLNADGTRLTVGAAQNDSNSNGFGVQQGYAKVFEFQNDNWVQLGTNLVGEGLNANGDQFGKAVNLNSDGNRVIVGTNAYAKVYDWENDSWVQLGNRIDEQGYQVDINSNGNLIILGGFIQPTKILEWSMNNWQQIGQTIFGFGQDVAMNNAGDIVIGGNPDASNFLGEVAIFEYSGVLPDRELPVITCPEPLLAGTMDGEPVTVVLVDPTATDNETASENMVYEGARSDGLELTDPFPLGDITISWTASDEAGNRSESCDQIITVFKAETMAMLNPDGSLVIDDVNGGATDENISFSVSGDNLVISSSSPIAISGDGVLQVDANTAEIPLGSLTGGISIDGQGGNDLLTIETPLSLAGAGNGLTLNNIDVALAGGGELQLDALSVTEGNFNTSGGTTVVATEANFFENGTLRGTGTLSGVVNMNLDSTLDPGVSPGILAVTGDLTLDNSNNTFEVGGTTPGTEHDQLIVNGTVTIVSGTTLDLLGGYANADGDQIVLISNDDTDPISGTFTGLAEGDEVSIGSFTGTITYTGGDGNDLVLVGEITVPDSQAPTITCLESVVVSNDIGLCETVVTLEDPTATDDVSAPEDITFEGVRSDGLELTDPFPLGETTITWTATDEAGNTSESCAQLITVNDTEAPTAVGQVILVDLGADGAVSIDPKDLNNTDTPSSDNCTLAENLVYNASRTDFDCTDTGAPVTVFFSVTDEAGTESAAVPVEITVRDVTGPELTCGGPVVRTSLSGQPLVIEITPPTVVDVCDASPGQPLASRSDGRPLTDPFDVGETLITWTALDAQNNQGTCQQLVTVEFTASSGSSISAFGVPGQEFTEITGTNILVVMPSDTDLGQPLAPEIEVSEFATVEPASGEAVDFSGDPVIYTVTAQDGITQTFYSVSVELVPDTEAPQITCPEPLLAGSMDGSPVALALEDPTATDNETAMENIVFKGTRSDGLELTDPFPLGETTITWTATDEGGNTSEFCEQVVTVFQAETYALLNPDGSLSLTDINGGISDDELTISKEDENLVITSITPIVVSGPETVQVDTNTVEIPFSAITTGITIDGFEGNDLLTIVAPIALVGTGNNLTLANIDTQISGNGTLQVHAIKVTEGDFDTGTFTIEVTSNASFFENASLSGNGTIGGTLNMDLLSSIEPGSNIGRITTEQLTFEIGSSYEVEINGLNSDTEHDQIVVLESVDIDNAYLDLSGSYENIGGEEIILVRNDGPNAVTGSFLNYPEGTAAVFGEFAGTISYRAGDGNDIALIGINEEVFPKDQLGVWKSLGPNDFDGIAEGSGTVSTAVDQNNTTYIAYGDRSLNRKIVVKKYVNGIWENVGNPGFSVGQAYDISMTIDESGIPYVVYKDSGLEGFAVRRFEDNNWSYVGRPGVKTDGFFGSQFYSGFRPSLEVGPDGIVYLAFAWNFDYRGIVLRFDGFEWRNTGLPVIPTRNIELSMDSSGIPYVVVNAKNDNGRITAYKLINGDWLKIRSLGLFANLISAEVNDQGMLYVAQWLPRDKALIIFEVNEFILNQEVIYSGGNYSNASFAVGPNNIVYVGIGDRNRSGKITVRRKNEFGWVNVVGYQDISDGFAYSLDLAINSQGNPVVAYPDANNNYAPTVFQFDDGLDLWSEVKDAGFSRGRVDYLDMDISPNGKPYVVYRDFTNDFKATVKRYSNFNWESVGEVGFTEGQAQDTKIALSESGIPFVVYRDGANNDKATVKYFTNSTWQNVGNPGISIAQVRYTDVAIDSNSWPVIIYQDDGNNGKATAQRYNGNQWEGLGQQGFTAGTAEETKITTWDGLIYVAYRDGVNAGKLTVQVFNELTTEWEVWGNPGFSSGEAFDINIEVSKDGVPYVAYRDVANAQKATVQKYNSISGNWEVVGTTGFTPGLAAYLDIAFTTNGNPVLAYLDVANSLKASVQEYNSVTEIWELVGQAGISKDQANYTNLVIDKNDNLVLSYYDNSGFTFAKIFRKNAPNEDNQLPVITCLESVVVSNDIGLCETVVTLEDPTATDDVSAPEDITFEGVRSDGLELTDPFPLGETTITWTATDEAGNTSESCAQLITVNDTEAPTAVGQVILVDLGADGAVSIDPKDLNNTDTPSSDNCTLAENLVYNASRTDFDCTDTGAPVTVFFSVTDEAGTESAAVPVEITVRDVTGPELTCGGPVVRTSLSGQPLVIEITPPTVVDVCDASPGQPLASRSDGRLLTDPFDVGETLITWTALDAQNNQGTCQQLVTVEFTASSGSSISAFGVPGQEFTEITGTNILVMMPSDTDLGQPLAPEIEVSEFATVEPASGEAVDFSGDPVIYTVTAQDGITQTFYSVSVELVPDTEAPQITCPETLVVSNDIGLCEAVVTPEDPTAIDNVSASENITFAGTRSDGLELTDSFPLGETTITWTATDEAGNTSESCEQLVTVIDTEAPTAIGRAITVDLGADGLVSIDPKDLDNTDTPSSDNCTLVENLVYNASRTDFNCADTGAPVTVFFSVTDEAGTESAAVPVEVTVRDVTGPDLTCGGPVVRTSLSGQPIVIEITPPTVVDVCDTSPGQPVATRSDGLLLTDVFPIGETTISWTATDETGNISEPCEQVVAVEDTSNGPISDLTLVNATADMDLLALVDGLELDASVTDGLDLSIRVNTDALVGSVLLELTGPVTISEVDKKAPYSLFGEKGNGSDFNGTPFPEGEYTVTVSAFDGSDGTGIPLGAVSLQFTIVPSGQGNLPPVAEIGVTPLSGDAPLEVQFSGSNSTASSTIDSYSWDFGDGNSSDLPNPLHIYGTPGIYTAVLTVQDTEGLTDQASIEIIVNDPTQNVFAGMTLVDATNNADITSLAEGAEIDGLLVDGISLSIRADELAPFGGSVLMELTGPVVSSELDKKSPYSLFGEKRNGSDYNGEPFPPGEYTVKATAYAKSNGTGAIIDVLVVNFTILPASAALGARIPAGTMTLSPNPASEAINLEFEEEAETRSIQIFDLQGRLLKEVAVEGREDFHRVQVYDLPIGTYIIKSTDNLGRVSEKMMVIQR